MVALEFLSNVRVTPIYLLASSSAFTLRLKLDGRSNVFKFNHGRLCAVSQLQFITQRKSLTSLDRDGFHPIIIKEKARTKCVRYKQCILIVQINPFNLLREYGRFRIPQQC